MQGRPGTARGLLCSQCTDPPRRYSVRAARAAAAVMLGYRLPEGFETLVRERGYGPRVRATRRETFAASRKEDFNRRLLVPLLSEIVLLR